ncbi:MAG: ATP-binding cassette domain-containing protein [Prolixibacteraceae bacterium]|jgi:molybdate transport system ATP-binding protein|nr:ATP-binding cassette domain-containing protein [Prolixibacteraceae bacterium]
MILSWNNAKIQVRTKVILDRLSFGISKGESLGIIGRNGSGKTVLAKAMAGKLPLKNGEEAGVRTAYLSFQSEFQLKHGGRAYRQQRWNLPDPEFVPTVREIFEEEENQQALQDIIERFNFHHHLDRFVISLSNGEQRKFELIKALSYKPELLVIDNAFNGLDATSRTLLHSMLNQMIEHGQQVILTGLIPDDFPITLNKFLLVENLTVVEYTRVNLPDLYEEPDTREVEIPRWQDSAYNQIFSLKNVSLRYDGNDILKNINWEVKAGEKWVLSGANGSGKTSLLNMIFADNPRAYRCDIELFGKKKGSGESIWEIKDSIGFISPEMHQYLPARQSVRDVVCSGIYGSEGLYNKPTSYQRILARKWLALIGLGDHTEESFGAMAASHQRMVLTVRALVKYPPLLIFDEPFQGLDPVSIGIMKNLLNSIGLQTNCAMIFVSHYNDQVPEVFDKELHLENGEVAYCSEEGCNSDER